MTETPALQPSAAACAHVTQTVYEAWPPRPRGGQHVGTGPCGVRAILVDDYGAPIAEACCNLHRSQFKNKRAADEMLQWALAS